MADFQVKVDPARVREAEERFARSGAKAAPGAAEKAEPLGGTLGNKMLQEMALPPSNAQLRSKNWFPAKLSDIITDCEWAIQYTCCRTGGTRSCTETSCPTMSAGSFQFPWQECGVDADGQPHPAYPLTAPRFCHKLVQWSTAMRTAPNFWDETSKFFDPDDHYTECVEPVIKLLMYRILCVYSHIFHHHWIHHHKAQTEEHFNHVFKHFVWFTTECKLLNEEELLPLKPVIDCMFEKERKLNSALPRAN